MPVNEKERQSAGDCIRQLREEKGYNIDSLAGLLLLTPIRPVPKVSTSTETGRATPDGMTLALAGYVFGVYPDALASGQIVTRKSDTEFMEQAKQILSYLESIKEKNGQLQEYDSALQKELDVMEKERKTEQTQEKEKRTEIQYGPKL